MSDGFPSAYRAETSADVPTRAAGPRRCSPRRREPTTRRPRSRATASTRGTVGCGTSGVLYNLARPSSNPLQAHAGGPMWSVLVVLLSAAGALAQTPTGSIDGTVRDTSGAVVPGVTVVVIHP